MYQAQGDTGGGNSDLYQAIYAFDAENPAELTLHEGDIVRVFNKEGGEWWEGQLADGRTGLFPANRVIEYYETTDTQPEAAYAPTVAAAMIAGPPLPAYPLSAQPAAGYAPRPPRDEYKGAPDAGGARGGPPPAAGGGGRGGGGGKGAPAAAATPAGFKPPSKPVPNTKFGYLSIDSDPLSC